MLSVTKAIMSFSVTLSGINCSGTLSPQIGALSTLTTL
ncbi:hypothetical protein OIU76_002673, partial [Salix suchowensis]